MHLVLIGRGSVDKIKDILLKNLDNLNISTFSSMGEFIELSNIRTLVVDRIVLLQDGVSFEDNLERKLESFNDYICSYYPAVRLVTLMRDPRLTDLCIRIFLSPLMIHITVDRIKPVMLLDIVQLPVEELKKRYPAKTFVDSSDMVVEEVVSSKKKEKEKVVKSEKKPEPEKSKGGGLFGFLKFGKKPKNGKEDSKVPTPIGVASQGGKTGGGATEEALTPVDATSDNTGNTSLDDVTLGSDIDTSDDNDTLSGNNDTPVSDNDTEVSNNDTSDEDSSPIGFSIFGEDSDSKVNLGLGLGVDPQTLAGDFNEENLNSLGSEFDSVNNGSPFFNEDNLNALDEVSPLDEESLESSEAEEDNSGSWIQREPSLDIHNEVQDVDIEVPDESLPGIDDKIERLKSLQRSIFTKNIRTVEIPSSSGVSPIPSDISEEEVNIDSIPVDNLDELDREYENKNVKVLERVVEVEKIVRVESEKRNYRNGIRVVIVTGDRRTGITRTAINMAAYFAKQGKTLFVDYDTIRRGSLFYFGLENVVQEEERIQNGLKYLQNVKSISSLTYFFNKGQFECLLSQHGSGVGVEDIVRTQRILAIQRDYETLIVDCPLENLKYLEDLVLYSEVLFCVEPAILGVFNIVLALDSLNVDEKFKAALFNNGSFLLSMNVNYDEFEKNRKYISDVFSLDAKAINWCDIPLIGGVDDFTKVLSQL